MTWTSDEAVARASAVVAAAEAHGLRPAMRYELGRRIGLPQRRVDEPPAAQIAASVTIGRHPLWTLVPSAHGRREMWLDGEGACDGTDDAGERVAACARLLRQSPPPSTVEG